MAHRRRRNHQVGTALLRRRGVLHRDGNGCRAVVRGVRLIGHRVHACAEVVRSGRYRRGHLQRRTCALRSGKPRHRVRIHLRVGGGYRRVVGSVVPQRRGRRGSGADIPHRHGQGRLPSAGRTFVAHGSSRHGQVGAVRGVRTLFRTGNLLRTGNSTAATCEPNANDSSAKNRRDKRLAMQESNQFIFLPRLSGGLGHN